MNVLNDYLRFSMPIGSAGLKVGNDSYK